MTVWQVRGAVERVGASLDHDGLLAVVDALWSPGLRAAGGRAAPGGSGPTCSTPQTWACSSTWCAIPGRGPWSTSYRAASPVDSPSVTRRRSASSTGGPPPTTSGSARSALLAPQETHDAGGPAPSTGSSATPTPCSTRRSSSFARRSAGSCGRRAGVAPTKSSPGWRPAPTGASGVTMREAVKYVAPEDRDALMAAYKDRRPLA